ncbi:polysaccharide pyruvyl transferase family protein [Rossellomorea marisflavi]|uniref:Polysaccharide pyruvyl transferase domain-containing protein n=1 Tax=Rossellomorea marisflavi TaxID=189381 RepID=A0A165INW2_9BACI|nr:polysaccharide pyruvyl transferase family protein [Rossellomorea marisflavi]KZE43899.1 hypothetical protein AV649_08635 [Rossellomorea marisflavi]
MFNKLRNTIFRPIKYKMFLHLGRDLTKKLPSKSEKKVFIMLAADYDNLGDVAITEAQFNFLSENLPHHKIIKIDTRDTYRMIKSIKRVINHEDIVTIVGGGNMGDLYEGYEELRRNIVKTFKENRIISFPQTIDFSDTRSGKNSLNRTIKAYNSHPRLSIFAREEISYNKMKEIFPRNNVELVPDIVLSQHKGIEIKNNRKGIILCLRDDLEQSISDTFKADLIKYVKNLETPFEFYDTHLGSENLSNVDLSRELEKILGQFSKSQLVITDRLHGMIFAAITGTSCIVLPNSNHKIIGTYEKWLKEISSITLLKDTKSSSEMKKILTDKWSVLEGETLETSIDEKFEALRKSLR